MEELKHKKRILVVDDETAITRMLKINLETTDEYVVRTENSAGSAVAVAEEFKPDLAILDVMMPELDGGQLASLFQSNPRLKGVPLVFLTAAATKREVAEHEGTIGGLPFLAKPISVPEVLACLRHHLGS